MRAQNRPRWEDALDKPVATLAWSVAVVIGLASPHVRAAGEQAPLASITVVVTDYADVPLAILNRAQVEAGRTYRRMGVRTTWLASARSSTGPPADSEFAIKLIIQPQLAGANGHGSRSAMAAALRTQSAREGSIYVFYDRVTDVAAINQADTALLMGIVIAHEMGHLLLHHADHAAEGLMRGVWDADAMRQGATGLLWFSPSEVDAIRKTLSTCCTALPIFERPRSPLTYQRNDSPTVPRKKLNTSVAIVRSKNGWSVIGSSSSSDSKPRM